MAIAVVIPKMGMTMTEGTLVEWLVPDGAEVTVGQPLFHMVTEKLDCDVEAEAAGRLARAVPPDTTLPPGGVVAWLLAAGENAPAEQRAAAPAEDVTPGPGVAAAPPPATAGDGRPLASPNARRVAAALGVNLGSVVGTGPGGRITAEDVEAYAAHPTAEPTPDVAPPAAVPPAETARTAVSPIARKLAARLGVDLATVQGSGPAGAVTRQDVEAAVRGSGATAARAETPSGPRPGDSIRLVGMRGTIARRMHQSLQEMAQLTLGMDVRVDRLVKLRDRLREDWADDDRRAPSYTDFVVKACALALRRHPGMNAQVGEGAVELLAEVHVGLAVAVDNGLIVPVVRHTDELTLADVAVETARLSAAARDGGLTLDDLNGGTFSVTTLGMYGVDLFTPVINPPNVGILGVGRIRDGVAWKGGKPKRITVMTLSLTFDHRAIDGAPAAAFLATVRDLLERPTRLLT